MLGMTIIDDDDDGVEEEEDKGGGSHSHLCVDQKQRNMGSDNTCISHTTQRSIKKLL